MRRCPRCGGQQLYDGDLWNCVQCGHESYGGVARVPTYRRGIDMRVSATILVSVAPAPSAPNYDPDSRRNDTMGPPVGPAKRRTRRGGTPRPAQSPFNPWTVDR